MRTVLFTIVQLTWGILQSFAGLVVYLLGSFVKPIHRVSTGRYRSAICVEWENSGGLSLGLFIFVPRNPSEGILVHEYGHCIQSLILGPLYLPLVGVPSLLWAGHPKARAYRVEKHVSYYHPLQEHNANVLGERVTGGHAPESRRKTTSMR